MILEYRVPVTHTILTMVMDAKETTRKGGGLRLSTDSEMNSQLSFGMAGYFSKENIKVGFLSDWILY